MRTACMALASLAVVFTTTAANAQQTFTLQDVIAERHRTETASPIDSVTPYIGVEYQYQFFHNANDDNYGDEFNAGNIHAGLQFGDHVAIEAGWSKTETAGKDNLLGGLAQTDISVDTISVDLLGYMPVAETPISLVGLIGGSKEFVDSSVTSLGVETNTDDDFWGVRFGGGVKYQISDRFSVRGLARYTDFINRDGARTDLSVGGNIHF